MKFNYDKFLMICKYTITCLMALIILFLIHLLIIELNYADESVNNRDKKWSVSDSSTKAGLYSSDDKVTQLTTFNFNQNVYNSSSAWVVQFYNSWCGHCIKFSPFWKELAADIYSWKDVVVIAAIDCADDLNTQHCRDYEVMAYPTIRYFSPWTLNITLGEEFDRGADNVDSLRHTVATKLQATEKAGIPPGWPDLLLVPDNDALWKDAGKRLLLFWNDPLQQLVLLVIENEASFAGTELILDLKEVSNVTVKRVLDSTYGNRVTATRLFAFFRPKEGDSIPSKPVAVPLVDATSRKSIFSSTRDYLQTLGIGVPDIFSKQYVARTEPKAAVQQTAEQLALVNTVLLNDLNSALRYSLFHEIPLQSSIAGEKLSALVKFLDALNQHYPIDELSSELLRSVRRELTGSQSVSGREFKNLARAYGQRFERAAHEWVACRGSDATLRGYPCGLWTLFHTLTVRELASLRRSPAAQPAPPQVLNAMAAYIRHFFGCTDCADHFTQMSGTIAGNVSTPEQSVLWLWRAHNNVNARLAGDGSEDPAFPKIQFPASQMCPECRDSNGAWREQQVLDYLVRMYSNLQRVEGPAAGLPQRRRADGVDDASSTANGWSRSLTDMRACIVLYVACAGLLTVYTLRFFVKRNPRSRPYKYDLTVKA